MAARPRLHDGGGGCRRARPRGTRRRRLRLRHQAQHPAQRSGRRRGRASQGDPGAPSGGRGDRHLRRPLRQRPLRMHDQSATRRRRRGAGAGLCRLDGTAPERDHPLQRHAPDRQHGSSESARIGRRRCGRALSIGARPGSSRGGHRRSVDRGRDGPSPERHAASRLDARQFLRQRGQRRGDHSEDERRHGEPVGDPAAVRAAEEEGAARTRSEAAFRCEAISGSEAISASEAGSGSEAVSDS